MQITPYRHEFRDAVLNLAIAAWTPVFEKTRAEVPEFVYRAFYPDGWQARQIADTTEAHRCRTTERAGRLVKLSAQKRRRDIKS